MHARLYTKASVVEARRRSLCPFQPAVLSPDFYTPHVRARCPSSALSHPFFAWEGSPTKIDYRKEKKRVPTSSNLSTGGPRRGACLVNIPFFQEKDPGGFFLRGQHEQISWTAACFKQAPFGFLIQPPVHSPSSFAFCFSHDY